jgi:signal transduction histidine kinase
MPDTEANRSCHLAPEPEAIPGTHLLFLQRISDRLSHDLGNPISNLLAGLRLLEQELPGDDEEQETVRLLVEQVKRIEHIVVRNREALRRPVFRPYLLPLQAAVRNALRSLPELAAQGDVRLSESLELSEEAQAVVDEPLLWNAVANLVRNAIEATPAGGRVQVHLAPLEPRALAEAYPTFGRAVARLTVRDEGGGIPPRLRGRLFNPYVSTKARGSGLGLAIARDIIESHGGMLRCEEGAGPGAVFHVDLPLGRPAPCWTRRAEPAGCERCAVKLESLGCCCWARRAAESRPDPHTRRKDCLRCPVLREASLCYHQPAPPPPDTGGH